ncbi:MAG: c-type cytochrome [Actinomycetota bacterium]
MRRTVLALAFLVAACGGAGDGSDPTPTGEDLAAEVGCLACHQETDSATAPSLHGIWSTEVTLEDGSSVTVDEEYVRRSITDPGAELVEGYGATMPTFPLDDAEVDRLVEWVESLG